jgi:hypothetical protein
LESHLDQAHSIEMVGCHQCTEHGRFIIPRSMGLLGVARANTSVGISPKTFLLLLLLLLLHNYHNNNYYYY